MLKNLSCFGFLLTLVGSALADSQSLIPTIALMFIGLIMTLVGLRYAEN